ncbi:MAG: metal-dependent hydrolase [Thiohalocapsa sp.]|nr:metal-dependent hydrolase [Thiohalocapsa sp.]
MLTPTHLATAHTAYLLACVVAAHPPDPAEAAVALGAALIPDLDSAQSYSGRVVPPLSGWIERRFGHRTLTHSVLAQAAVGLLAWWLLPGGFFIALVAGWVSHSVADMMTPSGVCWFWPSRVRCVLPGNPRYRMEVMGGGELAFLIVMALGGMLLMPLAETGKGSAGLIRAAIGDLESVRAEYDAQKGSWAFDVEVKGRHNATFADISGRYPIIGPWRESGLILDTDRGPVSLCTGSACDWYADHAKLERTERQDTTARPVRAQLLSADAIADLARPLADQGEVYLLGVALAEGVRPKPPTLEVEGEAVRFVYADPALLERLRGRTLRDVELTIQVRHAPGAAAMPDAEPEGRPVDIDPRLERWLAPATHSPP